MKNFQTMRIYLLLITLINYISTEEPKKVLLGINNEKIEVKEDCEQFVLPTNYKHLTIDINKTKNIDKLIITDQPLDSCQQKTCSAFSNICQIRSVKENSEIHFDTKMCVGNIYIYAIKNFDLENAEYSFNISTKIVIGENCSYIHENKFAYCGESNLDDCRSCKRQGCTVIDCGVDNPEKDIPFKRLYQLCLPYDIPDKEKRERCLNFHSVTNFKSTGMCEYDDLYGYSSFTLFIIGAAVIGIIVFGVSIIYYNIYVMKYNNPPFEVPNFMPMFLFPRSNITTNHDIRPSVGNLEKIFSIENKFRNNND